ncbi:MAG: T9SS type A sorting domain-containing protein [Calditrichaeota bacterium]|nr:T9SS type A sorting domain-containing protein [Calditrichota bacterium]
MKLMRLLAAPLLLIPTFLLGQVKINEVLFSSSGNEVELKNFGSSSMDVSNWWLCTLFSYTRIGTLPIISGELNIPAGGLLAVGGISINDQSADLGLYNTNSFASTSAMEDFVQWGGSGQGRESVAGSKGIWTLGDFVSTPADGHSLEYDGAGNASSDWFDQDTPTIGSENGVLTSVESDLADVPDGFTLAQNYPNPFNPSTQIHYTIARSGRTQIEIFNILGTKVRTLVNAVQPAGTHRVRWDGKNDGGAVVANGVYVYRLRAGSFVDMKKMLFVK